jgi:hypothetical protein
MIEYTVKVYPCGTKEWYLNGKPHREDGPSAEYVDGSREWHLNGKRHREDGPAMEYADGRRRWYLNGIKYTEEEFNEKTAKAKELTVAEIEELLGYPVKVVK